MTPMIVMISLAIGLMVFGLLICFLSPSAGRAANPFWWIGIVLAVCGVILLLAPLFVFLARVIRSALGT